MPTPAPIEQQILDAIVGRLEAIAIDDGYFTDAGEKVLDDVELQDPTASPPIVLSVIDAQTSAIKCTPTRREARMSITVSASVPVDKATGKARVVARQALADVRRALRANLKCPATLVDGVTQIEYGDSRLPIPPEGSNFLIASQDVAVAFTETFND